MSKEQTDNQKQPDSPECVFGERFASWWNDGADKAARIQSAQEAAETTERKAA